MCKLIINNMAAGIHSTTESELPPSPKITDSWLQRLLSGVLPAVRKER